VRIVVFLVQDNDRKRRQRRKRQHDLGAVTTVAVMAWAMMMAMTVMMTMVMTVVVSTIAVLVAITVAACMVRAPVAAIALSSIRGRRRRGEEGQGSDQHGNGNSLDAIHGKSPFWLRTG